MLKHCGSASHLDAWKHTWTRQSSVSLKGQSNIHYDLRLKQKKCNDNGCCFSSRSRLVFEQVYNAVHLSAHHTFAAANLPHTHSSSLLQSCRSCKCPHSTRNLSQPLPSLRPTPHLHIKQGTHRLLMVGSQQKSRAHPNQNCLPIPCPVPTARKIAGLVTTAPSSVTMCDDSRMSTCHRFTRSNRAVVWSSDS